ncbi:MAG: energy transducer TonB [Saprospiraceae bacterium]|nr:energy transducer TonB [Saprospiraceae bacterium]
MNVKLVLLNIISAFILLSCNTSSKLSAKTEVEKPNKKSLPETLYLVDANHNGIYELIEISEENIPVPTQGNQQFVLDFYKALRYPASARDKGIEGIVILEVFVDSKGKVTGVKTKKGISIDCVAAAEKAFIDSTVEGYFPLILQDKPTIFKMEMAVGFWLEK